jgi:S-methylmethionine-dependent homocysteine/selenocysteine methylase
MSKYRNQLPQLSPQTFVTDSGLETTLIFHCGYELPEFAAFDLLTRSDGYEVLRRYYKSYIAVALENKAGIPVVISFTLETDGRLPSGQPLGEAITAVDQATRNGPAYFMINCAHPAHFEETLNGTDPWIHRIRAIRANASTKSHTELDASTELDAGDPMDLGRRYAELKRRLPRLNIFGGCCGTDHRHVAAICKALISIN